jgi:methionyl-tRNA synthetase
LIAKRNILVTSALPYANAPLHLGHLVEYTQTDVWVRYQRMRGHQCLYVCASDAHGTPTMLRAEAAGIPADQLVQTVAEEHRRDFDRFHISVDNYLTTHSAENRELVERIYQRLQAAGHIVSREIEQAYDEQRRMFLPDRYVRGGCPVCKKPDQYGDSCENCGATYSPMDLIDPVSVVSGTRPSVRKSEHFFFRLASFEAELRDWVTAHIDPTLVRKLDEWFDAGLKDWDISRDAPYFGFEIPGEPGKYFYVWFDAPIGYMASFLNLCRRTGMEFDDFWTEGRGTELYHFIGKDIVYFHTLFWPAVLSGAGYRKPSGVFVHGFLTVDGQKMSKSRGTFIMASTYAKHLNPDCLRYYFAAKLGPSPDDLDLNLEDFVARVNSDLVGKLVNIASRCAGFVHRLADGKLADEPGDSGVLEAFTAEADAIASDYESLSYSRAVRRIMALADRANQYIDEHKPWLLAKDPSNAARVVEICTLGLNMFRVLILYLKPVVPELAERAEKFLGVEPLEWNDLARTLLGTRIEPFQTLLERIDPKEVEAMLQETRDTKSAQAEAAAPAVEEIEIDTFARVDLRVGRVLKASHVDGADKLLKLDVDLGGETRQIFSGIRAAYDPAELEGRLVIVVANLKPRKMRFGVSAGMVLAAGGGNNDIFLLSPDSGAEPGMKVT